MIINLNILFRLHNEPMHDDFVNDKVWFFKKVYKGRKNRRLLEKRQFSANCSAVSRIIPRSRKTHNAGE